MYRGLLVVNAFLRTTKFDELYTFLAEAAGKENMQLDVMTNAELVCALEADFQPEQYAFVVFWDKDVLLAQRLEQLGMRLFNPARGIALCDDKSRTWLALKDEGIPMPRTIPAPMTFANIGYPTLDFAAQNKIDYFIFGHYHCSVYMTMPSGARFMILKDWIASSPYLVFDGTDVL